MSETGSGGGNGGGGPGGVGSQVAQGASSAATAASGASQIADDPVGGATDVVSGAAGVAGAAGVEEAQQVADAAEAAGGAVQAAQQLEHDPVGGLLAMAGAASTAAGVAGASSQATQAAQSAVGAAQGAMGAAQGAASSAQAARTTATEARASAADTRARASSAREEAAARREQPRQEEMAPADDAPESSPVDARTDPVHASYLFATSASEGWDVRRVQLTERLNRPYEAIIDLANTQFESGEDLLGQPAVLTIERHAPRFVQGIVRRVELGGSGKERGDRALAVRVYLVPALWALSQRRDTRIFQAMTAVEILDKVLGPGLEANQREYRKELNATYKVREYCVQWEETDLDFVHRLMEEEGIWYRFDHADEKEVMVLGDNVSAYPPLEGQDGENVKFRSALGANPEPITELYWSRQQIPGKAVVRDYNWSRPALLVEGQNAVGDEVASREQYFHEPALQIQELNSFGPSDATAQATLINERNLSIRVTARATSALSTVAPGVRLTLADHAHDAFNIAWLVVAAHHEGSGPSEDDGAGDGSVHQYINHLELVPADVAWRPERTLWKRRVYSVMTAVVVGPSGEEIHTDEHGRIKVQFHWDRLGKKDDKSTCWIRSMQPWAGQGWGFVFLPRIGHEVVVTFVDGDIDRPLVVGSVYNGTNPPPYALPDEKTKSTIKSNSSPGGNGYNELRFEDSAGHEEDFIHAQKDMNEVVEHDHTRTVHNDETIQVDGNRKKTVDINETITIKGHQMITINGEGDEDPNSVKGGQMKITGKYNLYANDEIIVEAPNKITLKVPGSSIVMEPGKITLTSGGNSQIVLDANILAQSSGNSTVFLDANANMHASGGGDILLDANAVTRSNAGSHVTLDANALVAASAGAQANLTADATVSGTNATLSGTAASTVSAPTATLQGGAGSVEASASGVSAAGPTVNIAGAGSTSISGAVVKIN